MNISKKLSSKLYGKKSYQKFFEKLFYISLKGMNYGNGSDYEKSGEKYVFEIINNVFANKEIIIFDIGANVGSYSKALIKNIKPNFFIYAFEPMSYAANKLKDIKHENFKFYQFGFSNCIGNTEIHFDYDGSVWASIENTGYERLNKNLNKTETIELQTIDHFMNQNSINQIDFLKIDVEGHELQAFKGAEEALKNNQIKIIQFEFGLASLHANNKLKDFFSILSNYDIYRILQDGVQKITYHEAFEIYLTTNYLAVNKSQNIKL